MTTQNIIKSLKTFSNELNIVIDKYEIYFNNKIYTLKMCDNFEKGENKNYSYKKMLASLRDDPENPFASLGDDFEKRILTKFNLFKINILKNEIYYSCKYNRDVSNLFYEIIYDKELSDNFKRYENIDKGKHKLYLINIDILSIVIQRITYVMLGSLTKLIALEKASNVGRMEKLKILKEIETELYRYKSDYNNIFDNLEKEIIDRFESYLQRLNIVNNKIEEKIVKLNPLTHLRGPPVSQSETGARYTAPPSEASRYTPPMEELATSERSPRSLRVLEDVLGSKEEAAPRSPTGRPRIGPLENGSKKKAHQKVASSRNRSPLTPLERSPSKRSLERSPLTPLERSLDFLISIEKKLYNPIITNYDFENILSWFKTFEIPQNSTPLEISIIKNIRQKINLLLYISKKVDVDEINSIEDKNYLRKMCDTNHNKYNLNDIIKKINSYKKNIIVKQNHGITHVCKHKEIIIKIDDKNNLIFQDHFFKHFFEYRDCTNTYYNELINIIKKIFILQDVMKYIINTKYFSIFLNNNTNKIYQLDGELFKNGLKRNFIFYSIGVTYSLPIGYEINKFIFTLDKLPPSYNFDWEPNKERFCQGLTPVNPR